MDQVLGIGGILFGYSITRIFSHPGHQINKMIPSVCLKAVEFLPRLRVKLKQHIIHIHHWIFLSLIFASLLYFTSSFTQFLIVKSFCIGGIVQGFTYKDRFKILIKKNLL